MIEINQTWELVLRPPDRNVIRLKWVFRTKFNPNGSINKHKARLVVTGYSQIFGIDYLDTFALEEIYVEQPKGFMINSQENIVYLLKKALYINGFPYGCHEEIYVEQPKCFMINGQEDKVYLLKKALYNLKQAPRVWYNRINDYLLHLNFQKSLSEATLYVKCVGLDILIISLYETNLALMEKLKQEIKDVFEMTDLSLMTYFLGMKIT
ncbi:hypothetical protein CR513_44761, partial [Mucuna pruriens]